MLPDQDVTITVRPTDKPGVFEVTVSHAPTGVRVDGSFRGADNERKAVWEALVELQRNVAYHKHLASKGSKPWS